MLNLGDGGYTGAHYILLPFLCYLFKTVHSKMFFLKRVITFNTKKETHRNKH